MILFALMVLLISGFGAGQRAPAATTTTMPASAPAGEPAPPDEWRVTVATLNVYPSVAYGNAGE